MNATELIVGFAAGMLLGECIDLLIAWYSPR